MKTWNNCHVDFHQPLSAREMEVLNLISIGYSTKDIANNLYISDETVRTHRKHLLRKFSANNMALLVRKAFESGLI